METTKLFYIFQSYVRVAKVFERLFGINKKHFTVYISFVITIFISILGKAILYKDSWFCPNEFQSLSGRETAKDWKRSIRHGGKSLKVLMTKKLLIAHNNDCNCNWCTQSCTFFSEVSSPSATTST